MSADTKDADDTSTNANLFRLGLALPRLQLDIDDLSAWQWLVRTDAHPVTAHIHSRAGYVRYSAFRADDHGLAPDRYPSRGTAFPDGRIRSDRHRKVYAPSFVVGTGAHNPKIDSIAQVFGELDGSDVSDRSDRSDTSDPSNPSDQSQRRPRAAWESLTPAIPLFR